MSSANSSAHVKAVRRTECVAAAVELRCTPEYIRQRYELHAALVDAIADGDVKALDLIAEHGTRLT